MGRKRLPFSSLIFSREPKPSSCSSSSASSWLWASCGQSKTHSFRADISPEDPETFSSEPSELPEAAAILLGLSSDRFFFDPVTSAASISSIMERAPPEPPALPPEFRGGVAVAVDSTEPYGDFRSSMEEMVEAKGVADWEWLQEMLAWFLRANGKATHGFIVSAFLDLVVGLADSSSSSWVPTDHNPLYPSSSSSSNSSYSFEMEQMLAWFVRANGKATHGFIVDAFLDLLVGLAASSSSSSVPTDHNPLCSSSSSSSTSSYIFEIEEVEENGKG